MGDHVGSQTDWKVLTIPAIRVGSRSSLPLSITVNEPSQVTGAGSQRDIFLEAEVDSHFPYVQGQVLLTLRSGVGGVASRG